MKNLVNTLSGVFSLLGTNFTLKSAHGALNVEQKWLIVIVDCFCSEASSPYLPSTPGKNWMKNYAVFGYLRSV